jgi:argininosuccinate lyase
MYRSRPKGNLDDDVLRFLSSMEHDQSILYYDILGSEAHSIMLHQMGHLDRRELRKILVALESARKDPAKVSPDGFEDIHEAVEAFVIKRAGMEAGGKMHMGRSRNDQVVLDIRMKIRDDINDICAALTDLVEGLVEKAQDVRDIPMPMYTHLQQGQIGTFAHFLLAYSSSLMRDIERLYLSYQRINQSPLGAGAVGGSSISIDRKKTAVMLGFDSLVMNSIDATSSRDVFLEYVAALAISASSLSRIAEDFIIWSTTEFGYVELADRYSSTSSAMPQKKNPDPLELVRAKAATVTGNLVGMLGIVKALPSGYSRDLQDVKPHIIEASRTTLAMVKIMNGIVRSLEVNEKRMRESARSSYAIAIDIAEQIILRKKIPFRIAHKLVGALVDKAVSNERIPLARLEQSDVASAIKSSGSDLEASEILRIIREMTPEKSLQLRRSTGSPNPSEHQQMIRALSQTVENYKLGVKKRIKMVQGSFDSLQHTVEKYTKS